jgi:hypothetical protein
LVYKGNAAGNGNGGKVQVYMGKRAAFDSVLICSIFSLSVIFSFCLLFLPHRKVEVVSVTVSI